MASEFVARITAALIHDTRKVESELPGHTNFVLCGGRDSLNLLLLPWTNHTVALSAPPNYELVRRFVRENGLDVEVRSSRYIALWQGDSKALKASLERIAETARGIIDTVEALQARKAVA